MKYLQEMMQHQNQKLFSNQAAIVAILKISVHKDHTFLLPTAGATTSLMATASAARWPQLVSLSPSNLLLLICLCRWPFFGPIDEDAAAGFW